ncbi:dentin sialophosphoprotein-like isoform X1 [Dendronephthya gigantea]|uniref:dentin sialophosphoprotein-like isoform X1 n=1 Tax=Dendronephthya gigantea TaxID=151771 RepID=UPI00106B6520|nr:dentin sialophosphoprotein-like isoform X1 [Dendronephthya gigantea]
MADSRGRRSLSRKSKKLKISRSETNEAAQNCVICLDTVSCRGKLSVCKHWFCFICISEWSKNTNSCPVCKIKFRCISKIHLVPGKSPVQKIRVKDVDMRNDSLRIPDDDYIWAELESSMSESDFSNYEPNHDLENGPFHSTSDEDDCSMSLACNSEIKSDSGDSFIDDQSIEEMSYASSDSSENCPPSILRQPRRKSRVILSDTENSSDLEQTDNEWPPSDETTSEIGRETRKEPQRKNMKIKNTQNSGKSQIGARNGFHRNRQGRRKLSNHRFEEELNRRNSTKRSELKRSELKRSEMKRSSTGRAFDSQAGSSARERDNRIGKWLCTVNSHSQASSRSHAAPDRTWQSHTETRTTFHKRTRETSPESIEDESSSKRNDFPSTRYDSMSTRNNSRSTRNGSPSTRNDSISSQNNSRSTRNDSRSTRNDTRSTQNNSRSTRNDSMSTQNDSRLTRNDTRSTRNGSTSTQNDSMSSQNNSRSTRNDSRSTRNDTRSTQNNSRSTRNDSRSTQNDSRSTQNDSKLTRNRKPSHKKLTFNFGLDSSSCSSGESWNPFGESSGKTKDLENMSTKKSETRRRERMRFGQVLKDVQNVWDWDEDE